MKRICRYLNEFERNTNLIIFGYPKKKKKLSNSLSKLFQSLTPLSRPTIKPIKKKK